MSPAGRTMVVVLVLAGLGGGFLWWRQHRSPAAPVATAPATAPVVPLAARPAAVAPAAPPTIRHPIEKAPLPPSLDQSDAYVKNALVELLGKKAVLSFLVTDDFARRLVATVNNLATHDAAAESWPVRQPTGTFMTTPQADGAVISASNSERYRPFVRFVDTVDSRRAAAVYVRLYPILQRAYEDIGFSGHYFNDRVVEVIDHLLATPDLVQPASVKRVEVNGPGGPASAGRLYVFSDPALEAASTGQKILLRMGHDNATRLKAKLTEIRAQIAR